MSYMCIHKCTALDPFTVVITVCLAFLVAMSMVQVRTMEACMATHMADMAIHRIHTGGAMGMAVGMDIIRRYR